MRFVNGEKIEGDYSGGPQVLALGLPRCATSSLQQALETQLGYEPCSHMAHVLPFSDRLKALYRAMGEKDKHTRQSIIKPLFDPFMASADFPGMAFVEDLIEMYPDAKIILNQRESAQKWNKSINDTLKFFSTKLYSIVCYWVPTDYWHQQVHTMLNKKIAQESMGVDSFFSVDMYEAHRKHVLDVAKKHNREVLEWKVQEGWEPICKFLNKPVPNVPFPHTNDSAQIQKLKRYLILRGLTSWAVILSVLGAGCYMIWIR